MRTWAAEERRRGGPNQDLHGPRASGEQALASGRRPLAAPRREASSSGGPIS